MTRLLAYTDKVLPIAQQWQGRPLQRFCALVYMDAIHFNVKQDNQVVKKAVYVAIGVKIDGTKEVLGLWVGANESSKYWLSVLTEIRNRGVEDILIISIDNLKGFSEAIQAVYPYTEIQKCIVHQIRNSTRFVSYKDLKSFTSDLKEVYKATTEEVALGNLDKFEEKWG
ncbi:IS256 family transposase, partial [Cetobacterium sp.]|uniref:IS256 family transposase n=1 Tax=Cetobacterium sp. TaxID=2071632 RepID=UPI003AF153A4